MIELATPLGPIIVAKLFGGSGGGGGGGAVSSVNGKTGAVVLTAADLDDSFKDALLACFAHVAWTDEHGQDYYDALEAALYPPADLVSISAVYTQSGTVYDADSLDSLRADLVVTATYNNGDVRTVSDYVLSGTLAVGISTITVTYQSKTATFDVTVSGYSPLWEIENQTVPSGSSAIDSNIPLLETDTDFTVLYDITIEGDVPTSTSLLRIFDSTSTRYSLRIGRQTSNDTRFTFTYMGINQPIGNDGDIGTGRHRFVITHQNGSETAKALYRKEAGQLYEATISQSFTASSKNFVLGQTNNDAFKLPQCVLHKVAIYDTVLPESQINNFLGL